MYPSPAGAMESFTLDTWRDMLGSHPAIVGLEPGVEALLVNRVGQTRDHYLVPIDLCYKLVGLIRSRWHGLSGGTEVWEEIEKFFADLKQRGRGSRKHET
jgi:hypothetical protein